jgi:hypothetical protein
VCTAAFIINTIEGQMTGVAEIRSMALKALWRTEDRESAQHSRLDRQALEISLIRGFYMTAGLTEFPEFERTEIRPKFDIVLQYEVLNRLPATDRFILRSFNMVRTLSRVCVAPRSLQEHS